MAKLSKQQLEARKAAIKAEIETLRLQMGSVALEISKKARAEETRRKILVGAFYLERAKRDERANATLLKELGAYITRDDDRKLFGLPPLPGASVEAATAVPAPDAADELPDAPMNVRDDARAAAH